MSDGQTIHRTVLASSGLPEKDQARQAIAQASTRTGVNFDYLLAQAKLESGLDVDAKARTSSATGLFQFIESTWMETMQRHGNQLGLGQYASQVSDPAMRGHILALRNDPQAASLMAAALAQDNSEALTPVLGRQPNSNELYLAHFMGSGGASKFLNAMQQDPEQSAAALFPKPAAANRSIFYESDGSARSLEEVMGLLSAKMERAMPSGSHPGLEGSNSAGPNSAAFAGARFTGVSHYGGGGQFGFAANADQRLGLPRLPYQDLSMPETAVPPMSTLLQQGFNAATSTSASESRANAHAQEAYLKFKDFGL